MDPERKKLRHEDILNDIRLSGKLYRQQAAWDAQMSSLMTKILEKMDETGIQFPDTSVSGSCLLGQMHKRISRTAGSVGHLLVTLLHGEGTGGENQPIFELSNAPGWHGQWSCSNSNVVFVADVARNSAKQSGEIDNPELQRIVATTILEEMYAGKLNPPYMKYIENDGRVSRFAYESD